MEKHEATRVAGRGVVFITVSKLYFMLSGYVIYAGLTRILSKAQFGVYAVVTAIVAVLDAVLITGTIQSVSKFVSQEPRNAEAVKRAAIRLQMLIGGGIFLAYFLSAPRIAGILNDEMLVIPLRLSSLIVISYAFYAVYIGFINGLVKFGAQAALDMTFSTLKMLLVVGLASLGLGFIGAIGGFALAAFIVLIIAMAAALTLPLEGRISLRRLFRFSLFIMLFAGILNLLLKTDLLLLKRISPPALSNIHAAYYAAAQAFAFIPYQAIISITFVIFPLVSRLTYVEDKEKVQKYIKEALRYSLMIVLLIAVLFSSSAEGTIRLLFPEGYEGGAVPLSLLVFGIVFFSLFLVGATAISGTGHPAHSALIGFGTWMMGIFLNYLLIPRYGMAGAAVGTSCAMLVGMCAVWLYLYVRFGNCLPLHSLLRAAGAAFIVNYLSVYFTISDFSLCGKLILLGKFLMLALLYIALLFMMRELGADDIKRLKAVIGKK